MNLILSAPSVAQLRFDKIYRHMLAYLLELDNARFRGLGEAHCKDFVRAGLAFCDAHKLHFIEHIEYVHFMMYFIGTGFPQDPRYTALTADLIDQTNVSNVRIDLAHRRFAKFGERFVGVGLVHTKTGLSRFYETLASVPDEKATARTIFDAFYGAYDISSNERGTFPEADLSRLAQHSALNLDMETPAGQGLCLSLTLWLGAGFSQDPLYPWVRDIPEQAKDGPHERVQLLKAYALKRMAKMRLSEET